MTEEQEYQTVQALLRLADALERLVDLIEATAEDELDTPPLPKH